MGHVEDHRSAGLAQDRQAAHVGNQVVVAEAGAPFTGHETVVRQAGIACGGAGLVDHVLHVVRRQKLALLDVHRFAAARHGVDEIGLPAQEGGCLQHVDHRGHRGDLGFAVHVGQHRQVQLALDLGQDLQPSVHAGAAEGGAAAAVGFVVAALEDEGDAQRAGDLLEPAGDVDLQLQRLDHAGPGDQEEGTVEADLEATELHVRSPECRPFRLLPAAWPRLRRDGPRAAPAQRR